MRIAHYSGLAFALAMCGWFALGIGCQFPTIRPRPTAEPPQAIDMRGDEPNFPANVHAAVPVGSPIQAAKAILQSSGFRQVSSDPDRLNADGLREYSVRLDQPLAGADSASPASQNYFVTIYHDDQVVKRVEAKVAATGP